MPYSYRIGSEALRDVVPSLSESHARELATHLGQAMHRFSITGEREALMFIAQTAHESDSYRAREEYGSGAEYEGRRDLGNVHPGDGRRFKGRTYIQITGRTNYGEISRALGVNFVEHPTKLAEPKYAAIGAAWWWHVHGCNELARHGSIESAFIAVTRRINGGTNGLESREIFFHRAQRHPVALRPKRRPPH